MFQSAWISIFSNISQLLAVPLNTTPAAIEQSIDGYDYTSSHWFYKRFEEELCKNNVKQKRISQR